MRSRAAGVNALAHWGPTEGRSGGLHLRAAPVGPWPLPALLQPLGSPREEALNKAPTAREFLARRLLLGNPSKHNPLGKDLCINFHAHMYTCVCTHILLITLDVI